MSGRACSHARKEDVVRTFRPEPDAGTIVQPKTPPLGLFIRDFQPLTLPDPFHPTDADLPAVCSEQGPDAPVAISAILRGQFDNRPCQGSCIGPASWTLALCGTVLTGQKAGPALRDAEPVHGVINKSSPTRGAYQFPSAASLRICLSKVRSETARLRRAFSFSSSFRRRA